MGLTWCADADEFCRAPLGRIAKAGPFSLWCFDSQLSGLTLPPSADADQIRALFTLLRRAPLPGMAAPYDAIVDERQMTSMTSAATAMLLGFVESFGMQAQPFLRNVIIVCPRDPMMAMVANGFALVAGPGRVVRDLPAAFRALGRDEHRLANELDAALAQSLLREIVTIERWILEHIRDARVSRLALAIGKSERSLQRLFVQAGTSFAELWDGARQRRAQERLVAGDKIEVIARELGFSSSATFSVFFRRRVGMTPTDYRRRYAS